MRSPKPKSWLESFGQPRSRKMSILPSSITCKPVNRLKRAKASPLSTKNVRLNGWNNKALSFGREFFGRDFELFDQLFDFVDKIGGAGAVYKQLAMSGANEQSSN